jgi:hypothetical protein
MLVCRFYRSNMQRIDADNLLKHVCDSANGILWEDDSQVTLVLGEVMFDPNQPRTIILAGNHASTMLRGDDANRECEHCTVLFRPASGRGRTQRFCSVPCSHAARVTVLESRICRYCRSAFQPKTKKQVLCSRACRTEEMRGENRGRGGPKSRCTGCGKELSHRRGGLCRDCWQANPGFYATSVLEEENA